MSVNNLVIKHKAFIHARYMLVKIFLSTIVCSPIFWGRCCL